MGIKETVGRRIKVARTELGWNQTELANRLGTSQANIARYEKAKISVDIETLAQIAKVMNKPIDWFFVELPKVKAEPQAKKKAA